MFRRFILGGILIGMSLSSTAATAPKPIQVARLKPHPVTLDASSVGRSYEIRTADAAFVKVHFEHLSLPEGITLEVSSPDRQQLYRYSAQSRDALTVHEDLKQDGQRSFAAMSIHGPAVVLTLTGTARNGWTKDQGVRITQVLEGFPDAQLRQLMLTGELDGGIGTQSICGVDDKKAAACYASTDPQAFDRSRPVARLMMNGGLCTAWRVGSNNRMFTNNHCFSTASEVAASEVWFNYQLSSCGGTSATPTKVTGDQMLATNSTLDYTLFTVKNFANIASFGYLGLDVRVPSLNEEIFIAGHPGGRQKELSVVSDKDGGGRCRVNAPNQNGNGTNTDIGYYCDTEGGSSGSPVLARASMKAVALHHLGGCFNSGAKVSLIWPQVSSHFGGVIPDGDNGGGGNLPPTANFTQTVNGLSVSFTDTSTDSDGSIASRSWDFGDGSSSTASNPSKTYAGAGTYTVKLTVTDNGGASASTSKSVTVGQSGITYGNTNDVSIRDYATVESSVTVSGRTGNGATATPVQVNILHTYIGDLKVDLVAPDGSVYNLHNRSGGSADNIIKTFTVNLSSEGLNGTWKLRVNDNAGGDIGKIDSWSLTF